MPRARLYCPTMSPQIAVKAERSPSLQSCPNPELGRKQTISSEAAASKAHGLLRLCLSLALAGGVWACQNTAPEGGSPIGSAAPQTSAPGAASPEAPPAEPLTLEAGYKLYGAPLTQGVEAVSLQTLLAEPDKYAGKTVQVEAEVKRSCSKKGCWMELAESKEEKPATCRVSFKDYGFFVPLDSAGSHAKLQGVVQLETVSAARVDHLRKEGATFAKLNEDGTAAEVALVATGVALKPAG